MGCASPLPHSPGVCVGPTIAQRGVGGVATSPSPPFSPPPHFLPVGVLGMGKHLQKGSTWSQATPPSTWGSPKDPGAGSPAPPNTWSRKPRLKHLGEPRPQKTVTQPQAPDGRKPRPQTPGSRKPRPGSPVRAPPTNPRPTPSHLRAGSPAPKALQAGSPTPKHAARPQTPGRRKPRLAGSPAYPSSPSPAPASPRRALSPSVPPPGRCPCGGWGGGGRGSACGTRNPQREGEPQQRHSAVPPPPVPYEAPPPRPPLTSRPLCPQERGSCAGPAGAGRDGAEPRDSGTRADPAASRS